MFMALSDVPALWRPQLAQVDRHLTEVMRDADRLRQVIDDPTKLDPARDRDAIDRVGTIIQTDAAIELDQLFRLRRDMGPSQTQEIARLDARQTLLNRLRYTFIQQPRALTGDLAEPAKLYMKRTIDRLDALFKQEEARRGELQKRIDLYQWLAGRLGRETDPGTRANDNRLIELLIALDLTDGGQQVGPMYVGRFYNYTNISQIQEYREWFSKQERRFVQGQPDAAWWKEIHGVINFDPFIAARSPTTWLCAPLAIGSELCQGWGVPGFSMITLDDLRLRRDTPTDTPQIVQTDKIVPQLLALRETLFHAWNDPTFKGQPDLKWQRTSFTGQVVSPAPGRPVPDLPREGFLATYFYTANNIPHIPQPKPPTQLPWCIGVRRNEVRDTDAEGNYRFEAMPRLGGAAGGPAEMQMLAVEVFKTAPGTGAITGCTDLGKQLGDLKLYADLRQDLEPMRSVPFGCEEFSLVGLYDPRFLQSLGEVIPLDARRNADPQRYGAVVHNQMMAGFVEPGSLNSLLFRYGRVGNRLILINMGPGAAKARGYTVGQLDKPGPLALLTSSDFHYLDQQRLDEYRHAGVTSSLIDVMQSDASKQLDRAEREHDGAALMQYATGSWANNARVYLATQDMANDVVRGAIFLLLLCVPFSFCIERLLIGTANIYKQIAGAAGVFAVMTLALWSFHPAFKISSSPLIIVLAFAIIFMSLAVIFVVYGRFDTELKKISSGRSDDAFTLARAGVLSSAVLLGIANMRRRKFRTALTSITIVLITFAVLCFTSARRYLDTTTLPTGVASSYPGVQLRQRGYRPLPEVIVQNLRPLLPGRTIVQRWWNANPADPRDQIDLSSTAQTLPVVAFLGLTPGESQLSKIADVIGAEKFARLEKGERDIIYLPRTIAESLKVSEGDAVRAGGISLKIAGIFDPAGFDKNVSTLSGDPLAPLKYAAGALDADGRQLSDVSAAESFSLDANSSGGELGATYEHLPASQFVIVPAAISQLLPNAALRSIAVRVDNSDDAVKQASDELARRFALAIFAGYSDGVRMVSASNLTSVSGAGQVAIPLAIAGLIIFNTMMGSIAERKREIHVYTSLGLAPLHVGALFVAEALTYGLIGTVFGYIIGQGVGTLLLKFGWLGQVTLNYSGTAAIGTMGLILLIVLLSALVPARLASRLAAPSIERSWKVPLPADGQIKADLPFTINKTAADGALAYLADFFAAHREGTIGKFSAGKVEMVSTTPGTRGLKTDIWLTPFDLGIRQQLELLIHPGQFQDIYEVQVVLNRLSGDDASWYRMNRTFLTELRKQFLQWRSLSPQKMLAYVEESRKLFAAS
jgi:ABC-type lipoprotein release transport system permease subunit